MQAMQAMQAMRSMQSMRAMRAMQTMQTMQTMQGISLLIERFVFLPGSIKDNGYQCDDKLFLFFMNNSGYLFQREWKARV